MARVEAGSSESLGRLPGVCAAAADGNRSVSTSDSVSTSVTPHLRGTDGVMTSSWSGGWAEGPGDAGSDRRATVDHRGPAAARADEPYAVPNVRDVAPRRYRSTVHRDGASGTLRRLSGPDGALEVPALVRREGRWRIGQEASTGMDESGVSRYLYEESAWDAGPRGARRCLAHRAPIRFTSWKRLQRE